MVDSGQHPRQLHRGQHRETGAEHLELVTNRANRSEHRASRDCLCRAGTFIDTHPVRISCIP